MKSYLSKDIEKMEKRFRANFINSLSGFKSLNLVGTISDDGQTNLAPISSVIHVGATPPLVGMLIRPNTVPRDTLKNIEDTGVWTINHVNENIFKQAHQCSARYAANESEFKATGLTEEFNQIKAPFVKESNVKMGLSLIERYDVRANGTHFIIGQIIEIYLPEKSIEEDGSLNIEDTGTITVSGLFNYHRTSHIEKLPYAKA